MAGTVVSQLTNITVAELAEGGNWDDIVGGPGSAQTSDSPIQGAEARGRRISNTIRGFSYDTTTPINLSGAGMHVGFWVLIFQPGQINADGIELLVGDASTPKAGNWGGFFFDVAQYPPSGGWIRVWLDLSKTPNTSGGTYARTALRQFGCEFDMAAVGGSALNCQLDRIDYSTAGLLIHSGTIGSPAVFANFVTTDSGTDTNRYGVVIPNNGVVFVNARLTIGNSTATVFTDSGFALAFANQVLCATTFMGVTIDLQNASTAVNLTSGSIRSGGTITKGDFLVTGTAGVLNMYGVNLSSIRAFTFNSKTSLLDGCSISSSGAITAASAFTMTNAQISKCTDASAIIWNIANDIDTTVDTVAFTSGGTGHAIEFGTSSPTTMTLTNITFSGYAGTNGSTGNEAIWIRRTTGTVTINVQGGSTPTYRTDGATVIINNTVTLSVTVKDSISQAVLTGARVYLEAATGGPLPYNASVSITRSGAVATVTHASHGLTTGNQVKILGAVQSEYVGVHTITVLTASTYTFAVAGTPTTPATGTITATSVILYSVTTGTGIIEDTGFNFSSDQPVLGRVRKSSGTPLYKTFTFTGTIRTTGLTQTAFLERDDK
jgi:hypothetical protein